MSVCVAPRGQQRTNRSIWRERDIETNAGRENKRGNAKKKADCALEMAQNTTERLLMTSYNPVIIS